MRGTTRLMVGLVSLAAVGARGDAPAKRPSTPRVQVVDLADAKWEPATGSGGPAGAMVANISGDETKGPSTKYVKYPPGYVFRSHSHSATEYDVVLMGKPRYAIDGKVVDVAPGSYLVIPANTHHQLTCSPESECVVLCTLDRAVDFRFDNLDK